MSKMYSYVPFGQEMRKIEPSKVFTKRFGGLGADGGRMGGRTGPINYGLKISGQYRVILLDDASTGNLIPLEYMLVRL